MDDLGADSLDVVGITLAAEEKFKMHFWDTVSDEFGGPVVKPGAETVEDLIGATFIMLGNPTLFDADEVLKLSKQLHASIAATRAAPPTFHEKRNNRPTGLFGRGIGTRHRIQFANRGLLFAPGR